MSDMTDDHASGIVVEPLAVEQIESFHAALDAVARERRYLTFLEAPAIEETRQFIVGSLAKGNPHFVARVGNRVVGWCDILRQAREAHAHRGSLGMGIIRDFRGKGLGKLLITAALNQAWERNFTRIELDVHADNERAIALYENAGFVREGRTRNAFRADGIYRDALAMAIIRE